jgi:cation transport ATPase
MSIDSEMSVTPTAASAPLAPAATASQSEPARLLRAVRGCRDTVFRKLLVCADLASAAAALVILGLIQGHGIRPMALLTLALIPVFAKATGRYSRDELRLRKSTLEEVPALLTLAGANALVWSLITSVGGVQTDLRNGGIMILWASTAAALISFRVVARMLASLAAPLERVLIVGGAASREQLRRLGIGRPGTGGRSGVPDSGQR